MDKPAYIYALSDPDTGEVRYVGKADNPKERLRKHLLPSVLAIRCRRTSWLIGLLNANKSPVMTILERTDQDNWKARECYWIEHYRDLGARLVNTAEGGSGGVRSEWITPEMRANMSRAQTGKKQSAESIKKMVATRIGKPRSKETIAKMSAANKGKIPSQQCFDAQRKAVVGKKHTEDRKKRISELMSGNRHAKRYSYVATDPNGTDHIVDSLPSFCKEHGLDRGHMSKIANGNPRYQQHKGWKCRFADRK